tara:strand:- start:464 stop:763 length:300 start_codon:yes stop_codon:yes gene_type:complete
MPRYKLVNGEQIQLTAEEEAARDAEEQAWADGAFDRAMANLRAKRNSLLASSDWEVIMAKEKGTTLSTGFKNYRQELRDITNDLTTVDEVNAVVFPSKP